MSTQEQKNTLVTTIIIAAILISASLVYVGSKMGGSGKSFEEQLKEYQEEQMRKEQEAELAREQKQLELAKNVPAISQEDRIYGNPDAKYTIYEYSDFECPFCKRFYKTPKQIVDESNGEVNLVFRHFPLPFHGESAVEEAIASECAGDQGKFWEMHDAIFEATQSNGKGVPGGVTSLAETIGLDVAAFNQCMKSGKYDEKIQQNIETGSAAGVQGTPGNILKNNETGEVAVVPGAYPIEAVRQKLDSIRS